jgi:hypothetical protein
MSWIMASIKLHYFLLLYGITLLSDGDVLTHIKVIDNLTFHFMCQAQSDIWGMVVFGLKQNLFNFTLQQMAVLCLTEYDVWKGVL